MKYGHRRYFAALAAVFALACVGFFAAAGIGAGTVTQATFTYTWPGTTVTVPPQTFTSTVDVPTVTETVTTTATTTASSAPTYASEIAYTQTRPAFTVLREVDVTTQAQLQSCVTNIQAGDLCKDTSPTGFAVNGEFVINKNPSSKAEIDLGTGSAAVRFNYGGTSNYPSVWITNSSNLSIFGGDISNPVGSGGVLVYGHTFNVLWWGFYIHNVASSGLGMLPVNGAINNTDFQGEITTWGQTTTYDPHCAVECGTGEHGAILADVVGGIFTNNRLALYTHDGPTGAGVEIGNSSGGTISGNTFILKSVNLTKVALIQVAGNALQEWGSVPMGIQVPYLEADNLQGRAVDAQGVSSGTSMAGVVVAFGRASNTNQNTHLASTESGISATEPWDARYGTIFQDVLPL